MKSNMTEIFPEDLPEADFPQELLKIGGYMSKAEKEKAEEEKKKRAEEKKNRKKRMQKQKEMQERDHEKDDKPDTNTHHTVDLDESHHNAAIKVQANVCILSIVITLHPKC